MKPHAKLSEIDFYYPIDLDNHVENSCEDSGCDSICRCGVITHSEIKNIDIESVSQKIYNELYSDDSLSGKRNDTIENILYGSSKDLDIYCINRILKNRNIFDRSTWDIRIVGGYYGEEIGGVYLFEYIGIEEDLEKLFSLKTIREKVHFILNLEYGIILPELVNSNFEISSISIDDVIFPSDSQYRKVQMEKDWYKNYVGIRGIVKKSNGKYRVIDGYHRLWSAKKNGISKILVITTK